MRKLGASLGLLSLIGLGGLGAEGDSGSEEMARIAVSIVGESGEGIHTERYLAVVPEAAPWSAPAVEKLFEAGNSAEIVRWDLPSGGYRVVCSAQGYWVSYGETFELQAGEEHLVECEPIPTEMVGGRVRASDNGELLAGVTVGPAGLFSPGTDDRLGEVGHAHLRRISLAQSQEDGTYELFRPRGYSAALWAEKPGWSPAFRPSAVPEEATGEWPLLEMTRGGGSLSVSLSVPAKFPRRQYRLILLPLGPGRESSLPSQFQEIPFPQSEVVTWSSLPAGRYALLLRSKNEETPSDPPNLLATVEVRGQTRASVAVPGAGDDDQERERTKTSILIEGYGEQALAGFRIVVWKPFSSVTPEVALGRPVAGGTLIEASVVCEPGLSLILVSDQKVSFPRRVRRGDCEAKALKFSPRFERRSRAEGLVYPPQEDPDIGEATGIGLRSCEPSRAEEETFLFPAQLDRAGGVVTWSADLPAGCWNLSFVSRKFAPALWSGESLRPGESSNLPPRNLRRGAALAVRTVDRATGRPISGVFLDLFDESALRDVLRDPSRERPRLPAATVSVTNEAGWSDFPTVLPGRYFVRALHEERAVKLSDVLELVAARDAILPELELEKPGTLVVEPDWGTDSLIDASSLAVRATAGEDLGLLASLRLESPVRGEDGLVGFSGIPPGMWTVAVFDRETGASSVLGEQVVEVIGGSETLITVPVSAKYFEGRVTYEDEGLEALVDLRAEKRSLRVRTDPDGRFRLALRSPGSFDVKVSIQELGVFAEIPSVRFEDPQDFVEIKVPSGRIRGLVVDPSGKPIEAATVVGYCSGGGGRQAEKVSRSVGKSSKQGGFELRGLRECTWTVSAKREETLSSNVTVPLQEDGLVQGVELLLEGLIETEVILRSTEGLPIVGWVTLQLPPSQEEEIGFLGRWRFETDQEGVGILRLPSRVDALARSFEGNWVVSARSGLLEAVRQGLTDPTVIRLPSLGGHLDLRLTGWRSQPGQQPFLVSPRGAFLPLSSLTAAGEIREPRSGELQISVVLSPGPWSLVEVEPWWKLLGGGGGEQLADFVVMPGATVVVEISLESGEPDAQ